MFPEMRRMKQEISYEEAIEVLNTCSAGVLAVAGENGYPYTVPMNYAYADGRLLFHGATEGFKQRSILRDNRVSFCVYDRNDIVPEKFSTIFRSVVIFGRVTILTEDADKQKALAVINAKYSPGLEKEGQAEIERNWNRTILFAVDIEHMTGKIDLQTMIERAREAREASGETCPGKKENI